MNLPDNLPWVVLLRHGHSAWNLNDRFTGWTDIPLAGTGIVEAELAGRRLAQAGFRFDEAHVCALRRTRQTARATLAACGCPEAVIQASWRLNERHYGALQGLNKQAIFAAWGEARSRAWWRGYHEPPPPVGGEDPRHPGNDPRYAAIHRDLLPASESLRDCQGRALPYWRAVSAPRVAAGRRLLVVSHGNTLRGLVMHLDAIDPEAMERVEIPSGVPLVYRFTPSLDVLARRWLE